MEIGRRGQIVLNLLLDQRYISLERRLGETEFDEFFLLDEL
jgi:hypothetical protein